MNAEQLKIFQNITLAYFSKVATEEKKPVLQEAYLKFDAPVLLDYTSVVFISGNYEGCLYLTTTTGVLEELLARHGEGEINEKTRLDMCRELSNVLAGNASLAFGADWTISVPQSITADQISTLQLPPSTFIMPFLWKEIESYLVVGLKSKGRG
ncbi:MAG: chemotaxis protein CheX [Methylacidiphilales bacterium]|nr:chemotaxis protein CheX [Candidatus Methylacidiphilales bacterium]